MCVVCVSVTTIATLIAPTAVPSVQNNISEYTITKKVCSKSQLNTIKNNHICLKNGKVYRWAIKKSNIVVIPQSQNTNVKTKDLDYETPSEPSDNIQKCEIKEQKLWGARNSRSGPEGGPIYLPSGFPRVTPSAPHLGNIKFALIPIDFPDLKGDENFRNRIDDQTKKLSDWYFNVSEGKLNIEWSLLNRWITLPKETKNYLIENSVNLRDSENGMKLWRDAMAAADLGFDFTNIQQVIFILPKGQTFVKESLQGFPWDKAVIDLKTNEGSVAGFAMAGAIFDDPGREYWSYWAHEYGHSISLAHIGSSRGDIPPFNPWDLMGGQDGPSKELSGWLRFLAGWMDSNKVYCKTINNEKEITLTLRPLSSKESGIKMVVMPLPSGKALIVESRRVNDFSCKTYTKRDGILAYVYDPNLGHGEDFLVPLPPIERNPETWECNGQRYYNALTKDVLLRKGNKVTIEGITVEVLEHANLDKISIKKQK